MVRDLQKASMWKRISAYIFDCILVITVAVGVAFLLSAVLKYDDNTYERELLRQDYEIKHGVEFDIKEEDFRALSEDEQKRYNDAYAEFATDPEVNRIDVLIVNLTLIIIVFGLLVPFIIFEVLIPLLFGNGQTLGKKIFGIAVMRVDGVKLSGFQLFVRSILGKYVLETMTPVFLVLLLLFNIMAAACLLEIAILLIFQIIFILRSDLRTPIHDMIAGTVAVDLASQMIFDSPEALLEYKKKLSAEAAERAEYR